MEELDYVMIYLLLEEYPISTGADPVVAAYTTEPEANNAALVASIETGNVYDVQPIRLYKY